MQMIDYQQLKDIQSRNAAPVINVLSASDFEKAHIPGSQNVPHDKPDFADQVKKITGNKDAPVVVYCASYSCDASKKAALRLEQAGFTNVMCYEGGTKEWQEKNPERTAA